MFHRTFWLVCGLVLSVLSVRSADADLIKLKNGGEIRGTISSKPRPGGSDKVVIETLIGTIVEIDRAGVEFVTKRSLTVEEYETRKKTAANTVEAQWELAEWCRKQKLKDERGIHLQRVLELDPEHTRAHYGLGHTKREGRWMSKDDIHNAMLAQGYVKYKGKYITPQELELIEKSQVELESEREWFKKVRLWHGWLTGRNTDRAKNGLELLEKITDADAVSALMRLMQDDKNKFVRALYVKILTQIGGNKPVGPLVAASLTDTDREVRYAALNGISAERQQAAIPLYIRALKHDLNGVVQRAATALGRIGDAGVVPALIDSLVTTHRYKVTVRGSSSPTYSFGTNGSFANPNAAIVPPEIAIKLRTGQLPYGVIINRQEPPGAERRVKVVNVKLDQKNSEVLSALTKLTRKDFGYDKRTWNLWWTAQKNGVAPAALP